MEEKNELNDIILNKQGGSGGSRKIVMAVATLAIILIIVVVIMNRLNSDGSSRLPQAALPPEPVGTTETVKEEPLFEPVEVIEEQSPAEENLERIARKLKAESLEEEKAVVEEKPAPEPKAEPAPKPAVKSTAPAAKTAKPAAAVSGRYYVQVGSFTRYKPNARFLKKITDNGFQYTFHKVTRNGATLNKVLVGPFDSDKEARRALSTIRKKIEAGAFLTKV